MMKKLICYLAVLALALGMLPALTLAQLDPQEPVLPDYLEWTPGIRTLSILGVDGQEYAIVDLNGTLDWADAIEPDGEGYVTFTDLKCATQYSIFTRIKGGDGMAAMTEYVTGLEGYSLITPEEGCVSLKAITVVPDPADADVIYQGCYDAVTDDGMGGEMHSYTPIPGETRASFTSYDEEDLGKMLAVRIMTRGYYPVETVDGIGPVYDCVWWHYVDGPTAIECSGWDGQEYLIMPQGEEPDESDWAAGAVSAYYDDEDEDWYVRFEGLTPATAYEIYTRPLGAADNGAKSDPVVTKLSGDGLVVTGRDDELAVGTVLTVWSDPAVDYQWFRGIVEKDEGFTLVRYYEIPGATGASYTVTSYDIGTCMGVGAYIGDERIGYEWDLGLVSAPEGAPELSMWDQTVVEVRGVEGQEYAIAQKGGAVDWSGAKEPAEGFVTFDGLTSATEYEVYAREKGSDGDGAKRGVATLLESCGLEITGGSETLSIGTVLTADPAPVSDALQYQWYRNWTYWDDDEPEPIHGATDRTYTATEYDVGAILSCRVSVGGAEIGDCETAETVREEPDAPVRPRVIALYGDASIGVESLYRQEYIILPRGTEPTEADWDDAISLSWDEAGPISFEGLDYAAEYVIYTRTAGNSIVFASEPVHTEVVTLVGSLGLYGSCLAGDTFEVVPDEDVTVDYQWCELVVTPFRSVYGYESERYDYIPIEGAVESSYLLTEEDVGKTLGVKLLKNGTEVGCFSDIGPIVATATVEFDTFGGSEVPAQTDISYGGKITKPEDPTMPNYAFLGWFCGDHLWDFENDTVTTDYLCLDADWAYVETPLPTVTVPVSGEEENVGLSVKIDGATATVTGAEVDKVLQANAVGTVTVDLSALPEEVTELVIPQPLLTKLADAVADEANDADALEVVLPGGSVSFDAQALAAVRAQAVGSNLRVSLTCIGEAELSEAQRAAIAGMEVCAIYDAHLVSNGQRISSFGGGTATLCVPLTLAEGQTAEGIRVWYLAEDGAVEQMPAEYDNGTTGFVVPHMSDYVIAYDPALAEGCAKDEKCPLSAFADLDPTAWYHDGVHYCLESGLMQGTGHEKFSPDAEITRAMLVTMLYRMAGEPEVEGIENPFTDVAEGKWYTDAVLWAAENGLVQGNGKGKFAPNDALTREQLAAILYRCTQSKGRGFTGMWMFLLDYTDAAEVSEWADEAMHWCVMQGVINGKDGALAPKQSATRAETATMLMRWAKAE